jgi:hypothetical protein
MLGNVIGNQSVNKQTGVNYVKFNHVAKDKLHMNPQQAAEYIGGDGKDVPELGRDLRWFGSVDKYADLEVHNQDADEFIKRVKKHIADKEAKEEQEKK